jgi:hypothetical protein
MAPSSTGEKRASIHPRRNRRLKNRIFSNRRSKVWALSLIKRAKCLRKRRFPWALASRDPAALALAPESQTLKWRVERLSSRSSLGQTIQI